MPASRARRGLDRVAEVNRDDLARLQAAIALNGDAFHARALGKAASTVRLEHGEMDQDIPHTGLVGDDEAESARPHDTFRSAGIGARARYEAPPVGTEGVHTS